MVVAVGPLHFFRFGMKTAQRRHPEAAREPDIGRVAIHIVRAAGSSTRVRGGIIVCVAETLEAIAPELLLETGAEKILVRCEVAQPHEDARHTIPASIGGGAVADARLPHAFLRARNAVGERVM